MLYAIFFCSAALGGACYPAEGKQTAESTVPTVIYAAHQACEKKKNRAFAPHSTANISYECFTRRDGKWGPKS